jgi:hypothetical protein
MIDSLKSSDQEWAQNHFKLKAVIKRQGEQDVAIAELQKENANLKKEVETLRTSPPTGAL